MKKHIIFIMLLLSASCMTAQQMGTATQKINKDYFKKSKKEKKTAWTLLGGGAALFTAGVLDMQQTNSKGSNEMPLVLGGMLTTISSVPFFISSAVNKHKARLELRKQAMFTRPGVNKNIYQTSVSIKIDL